MQPQQMHSHVALRINHKWYDDLLRQSSKYEDQFLVHLLSVLNGKCKMTSSRMYPGRYIGQHSMYEYLIEFFLSLVQYLKR